MKTVKTKSSWYFTLGWQKFLYRVKQSVLDVVVFYVISEVVPEIHIDVNSYQKLLFVQILILNQRTLVLIQLSHNYVKPVVLQK